MAYKILSLDGGGSWALIQARVLQDLYGNIRGHELLQKFDMAIANSGGSLVLASLCNNMLLSEIIHIFETQSEREQVFSYLTFLEKLKPRDFIALFEKVTDMGPKYSTDRKLTGLTALLKQYQSGQTATPIVESYLDELPAIIGKPSLQIVIVGYDYFRRRATFFRSNPESKTDKYNNGNFYRIKLAHAIHASSNAPVNYFDAPATVNVNLMNGQDNRTTWYWDGAVSGFNNPILAGLTEAITNGFDKNKDYRILSIGTGTGDKMIITDYDGANDKLDAIYKANLNNDLTVTDHSFHFLHDVKEMATSILGDPPDSASFLAYAMLHPDLKKDGNIVRINPCMVPELNESTLLFEPPAVYKDAPDDFKALLAMDMDAVKDEEVKLITTLCDKFIVNDPALHFLPNQLIRGKKDGVFLGDYSYREAKARWTVLDA